MNAWYISALHACALQMRAHCVQMRCICASALGLSGLCLCECVARERIVSVRVFYVGMRCVGMRKDIVFVANVCALRANALHLCECVACERIVSV